ncbi:ATP-binding cassette domain-containing protein, partial [Pseudomonas syringae pv. tagetis]|uniref:ATP-binding cassette domain-containing protein n=1 Tax=Pseudomonas syringae group genomosp. 7 TaxID=251699 RepID=UPI00376F9F07
MALLRVERMGAQYRGAAARVLAVINLCLGPQQLLVALGPSCSGKTSFLNLIAGFIKPDSGNNTLDGIVVEGP